MTAATTLLDEVTAVMADVVDYDGNAITGLSWALGRRHLTEQDSPPRVVWVMTGGPGSSAQKHAFPGGRRSLRTRNPVLKAICWGDTDDATNDLASAVLAAAERRWHGRFAYQGEEWIEVPAWTHLGEVVTISFGIQIAVLDRAPTRATVTTATPDATGAALGDGVMHVGETP